MMIAATSSTKAGMKTVPVRKVQTISRSTINWERSCGPPSCGGLCMRIAARPVAVIITGAVDHTGGEFWPLRWISLSKAIRATAAATVAMAASAIATRKRRRPPPRLGAANMTPDDTGPLPGDVLPAMHRLREHVARTAPSRRGALFVDAALAAFAAVVRSLPH